MKKMLMTASLMLVVFLAGCGSVSIGNVGVPGSAKNAEPKTVGKNSALSYISDASIEDACTAQVKLLTDAKWTESDAMENNGTYLKATYTDGKAEMVLVCSTTEVSATEKATKVTLTLIQEI